MFLKLVKIKYLLQPSLFFNVLHFWCNKGIEMLVLWLKKMFIFTGLTSLKICSKSSVIICMFTISENDRSPGPYLKYVSSGQAAFWEGYLTVNRSYKWIILKCLVLNFIPIRTNFFFTKKIIMFMRATE